MCDLIASLLKILVDRDMANQDISGVFLEEIWIESMANTEMTRCISQFENLKTLKIRNCSYVTGEILQNLKSKRLTTLDFSSSYQIELDHIIQCVQNNA